MSQDANSRVLMKTKAGYKSGSLRERDVNSFFYLCSLPGAVICILCSPRAVDSGDTTGLKCRDLTSDESRQCR